MKFSEYIVDVLIRNGVKDAFGIPGGVLMEFLHELEKSRRVSLHLNYHEQASAYAACGYAQQSGNLCLAYATKGPGVCNMVTAIAEAYVDSIPVVFLTAHSGKLNSKMRMLDEQEINLQEITQNITKKSIRIDNIENACWEIEEACRLALEGRKGPVFIDINAKILNAEISILESADRNDYKDDQKLSEKVIRQIKIQVEKSIRPILLVGDGVKQANVIKELKEFVSVNNIPVLSSRCSQDILKGNKLYYGYIGSHATRYSNFIFAKADLVISLGNRMSFPSESETYKKALENKKIIRIDVDETEFERKIPNSISLTANLVQVFQKLNGMVLQYNGSEKWIQTCDLIRDTLWNEDVNIIVKTISNIIEQIPEGCTIVGDIGNNELLLSRAVAYSKCEDIFLCHSKSMKTVGCAIPKAIGCYYAKNMPVICFTGDQGAQFNIQELQYISSEHLPIKIVILNNLSSGMLRDFENKKGYNNHIQTTTDSGYSCPDFERIARAYGIKYICLGKNPNWIKDDLENVDPLMLEINISDEDINNPSLPKGNECYDFEPPIEEKLFEKLVCL